MSIFRGEIRTSTEETLRSIEKNEELARYLQKLGLSGDETMEWILLMLYAFHSGRLINGLGLDEKALNPETKEWEFQYDVADEFGDDPRHWLNDYKRRANELVLQKLHYRLVKRVMLIEAAILVHKALLDLAKR